VIGLDEPVATYLPSFAEERRKGAEGFSVDPRSVTIRHCLTHTAGFTYFFNTVHPHQFMSANEAAEVGHFVESVTKTFTEPLDSSGWAEEYQAKAALAFEPGTHFNYSEGPNVLSAIVEKITGKPFSQYVEEEIVGPIGAKEIAFECPDYGRMPTCRIGDKYEEELGKFLDDQQQLDMQPTLAHSRGDVGLKGTAEDLVRYGQMLLRGGKAADGTTVLGEKAFELRLRRPACSERGPWSRRLLSARQSGPRTRRHTLERQRRNAKRGGPSTSSPARAGVGLEVSSLTRSARASRRMQRGSSGGRGWHRPTSP